MIYTTCFIENNVKKIVTLNVNAINKLVNLKDREFNILNKKRIYNISTILIKNNSIILKLDFIKAIITKDLVILFDIENIDVENFSKYLVCNNDLNSETIHELRILDNILSYICSIYDNKLDSEMANFLTLVNNINTGNNDFNNLVKIHNQLVNYQTKVSDIKNVIDELLASDEDMSKIYVSRENNPIDDHNEVELLLENYEKHTQEILNEISGILKDLDINQRVMNLNYANSRNKIALLNLKLSYISLAVSCSALVPSIFGMNLKNNLETSFTAFMLVIFLMIPFLFFTTLYFLKFTKQ